MGKQKKASSGGRQQDCILDITNFSAFLCDSKWKVDSEQFSTMADSVLGNILMDSSNAEERMLYYALLSKMISMKLFDEQRTKMYPFIDRVGFLIERVTTSEELASLRTLVVSILSWNTYDINVRLSKIISKFIGSLVRVLTSNKNGIDLSYILDILVGVLDSQVLRTELPKSSINLIYTSCLPLTLHPSLHDKSSDIIATLLSFEQIDDWNSTFICLCKEIVKFVGLIDITLDGIVDKYFQQSSVNDNNSNKPYKINFYDSIVALLEDVSESKRGLIVGSSIRGIFSLMKGMISNGSNAGPISIDLTICLSIVSTVLSRDMDLSNQARCSIQNVHGISANVVFPILCQIKLSTLDFLFEILAFKNSNLYKMSYIITEAITSLILCQDFKYNKAFSLMTLQCIDRVIKCFPLVIASTCVEGTQSSSTGIGYLIELYASCLVDSICNDGQTLISANENEKGGSENSAISEMIASYENEDTVNILTSILTVAKTLLTFCSPSLPKSLRKSLEIMSAKMLTAIGKGVLSRVPKDKRIKRAPVSRIRSDYRLQHSALDFALTEILTPYGDGKMSGNITLLQNACKACIYNNAVSGICAQALLIIDNIMSPSMVSIPPVSINILAKNAIEISNDDCVVDNNAIFNIFNHKNEQDDAINDSAIKRKKIIESNSEKVVSSSSFSLLSTKLVSENQTNNKRTKVEKKEKTKEITLQSRVDEALKSKINQNEDDSDIEIPDIN